MTEQNQLWDAIYEFADAASPITNADEYPIRYERLTAALAAHDAEVAANALRKAAADIDMSYPSGPVAHRGWLRLRADRIEREATNHKPTPELGSPEDER